jgi:transcriptional regulator with XRE-family HTH domain
MSERLAFGEELQRTRERRGLSLEHLAERTKISGSLFAGLERGDLSRWPSGIFRRAFMRAYAEAVGLEPEETVTRFLRLYPDVEGVEAPAQPAPETADATADPGLPRLVLDAAQRPPTAARISRIARRVGAPLVDLLIAGIPAVVAGDLFGWQWFWVVAAGVGLVGHLLALPLAGATPGAWLLLRRRTSPINLHGSAAQVRRRLEQEPAPVPAPVLAPVLAPRRRQPRHASGSRPVAPARPHRIQR